MKIEQLIQGSPEWLAYRAQHFNASDAPAMMGCSPHKTRTQLLHELHTGVAPEVDPATQRRFDDGHRYEALARPLAEKLIEDDLYPVTGSEGRLSASFDGLNLDGTIAFEHKGLNEDLCVAIRQQGGNANDFLPLYYRVQMEQQCAVSGCERVLFMASKWADDGTLIEERHCWYTSDLKLRAEIMAGWAQFEIDLAEFKPREVAPIVVAAPVQSLPSVLVQVSGEIAIRDNFSAFEVALRDFLEHRLIREPKTDEDFATLDVQIKAMKGAEAALDSAETQMLAQIATVDTAKKTKDMLAKLVRDNRLMAEKLLASEKDRRRGEIVASGVKALQEHVAGLNARLGEPYMPQVPADFGGAIKGKKSLASMEDAVSNELARAKIAANEIADRIQANMKALVTAGDAASFPDARTLVLKAPDDLAAVIAQRVAETERRLEEQRERIRQEEAAKLQREQASRDAEAARAGEVENRTAEAQHPQHVLKVEPATADATDRGTAADVSPRGGAMGAGQAAAAAPVVVQLPPRAANEPATLKLGTIQERLGINISSAFLAETLRIQPAATQQAAKLYRESDFDAICVGMIRHIEGVRAQYAGGRAEARA